MRVMLRTFVFSYISLFVTQRIVGALYFGGNSTQTMILITLCLSLLMHFIGPILRIISLPSKGIAFVFLNFTLVLVMLYVLAMFIPSFFIQEATIAELLIFGIVLPAKKLTVIWSASFTALLFVLVYNFLGWLSYSKKKK